jgi:hypothetical protein
MQKKTEQQIKQEFKIHQNRQIMAIAAALFLVMLGAVLYKRPDLLGAFSGQTLFMLQAVSIAVFLGFTVYNWRCPSCHKLLGSNIHRQRCKTCGVRLQ